MNIKTLITESKKYSFLLYYLESKHMTNNNFVCIYFFRFI